MTEFEGKLDAAGLRVSIVAARFNNAVVTHLVRGAQGRLRQLGARPEDVEVIWVPGAFEIPAAVEAVVAGGRADAVVCLGAVIRGATPHFDVIVGEVGRGISRIAARGEVGVGFGVLTCDTIDQALERAGGKAGNKGSEAAEVAIEMRRLLALLDKT